MTIAKRKMSMKKFLPSLTQIPEERQSYVESKCSFENNTFSSASHKNIRSQKDENSKRAVMPSEISTEYRTNEDKEKRQIIQKWLQSIPPMSEEICNHIFRSKNYNNKPNEKRYQHVENIQNKSHDQSTPNGKNLKPNEPNVIFRNPNQANTPANGNSFPASTQDNLVADSPPAIPKREPTDQYKPKVPLRKKSSNLNKTLSSSCGTDTPNSDSLEKPKIISDLLDDFETEDQIPTNVTLRSTNNSFSSSLPLDEELTMHNAIYNVVTGSTTLSKLKARYETFDSRSTEQKNNSVFDEKRDPDRKYSLVTEVYVNDGYDSSETSLTSLNSSREIENEMEKPPNIVRKNDESSRLMIQLNDCPFFYSVENVDDFEPDTLDRKPSKENENNSSNSPMNFVDSLERPAISLRTYGSFRQDSSPNLTTNGCNLKKTFGSLQEIYELRRKTEEEGSRFPIKFLNDDSPQSLSSNVENMLWRKNKNESRHRYRQRKLSPPPPLPQNGGGVSLPYIPTKITKPPLPPKKSENGTFLEFKKPDMSMGCKASSISALNLPSFLSDCNSANRNELNVCFNNNVWTYRPEDSGYLSSSDSDKSKIFSEQKTFHRNKVPDTGQPNNEEYEDDDNEDDDDSLSGCNDGNSESGAESIETNFKFYKNRGKPTRENFQGKEIYASLNNRL